MDRILDYYKRAEGIDEVIKESLQEGEPEVVYGARSVNVRMPSFLQKFTRDWDVYSQDAEQTARDMEESLDEYFGGNFFAVQPARHKGTFRVVSLVTRENVADITLPEDKMTYQVIGGVKYATLDEQVANIKKALADPSFRFRHVKDSETLQRIELYREYYEEEDPRAKKPRVAFKTKPKAKRRAGGLAQILHEFKE